MFNKKRMNSLPFSRFPLMGYEKWADLPILNKNVGYLCVSVSGIVLINIIFQELVGLDPYSKHYWVNKTDTLYWFGFIFTLIATFIIFNKQWKYYYQPGLKMQKNGIFKMKIRQVNCRESDLDLTLALSGGLLFALTLTPIFWFVGLSFYSSLVCLRSYTTLKREAYLSIYKRIYKEKAPRWYSVAIQRLEENHQGFHVKSVLAGWMITTAIISASSLIVFATLLAISINNSLLIAFVSHSLAIIIILVMWMQLSSISYKIGRRLVKPAPHPSQKVYGSK